MSSLEFGPQLVEFAIENKEIIAALGTLLIAAIGLSYRQREAIRKRDEYRCQSLDKRIRCSGRLEVDHILPKEFAEEALKMLPEEYNSPENLITKCLNHHRGHPNSHHPDMLQALQDYREGDLEAIARAAKEHARKARQGIIYWNNENDRIDRQVAKARNELHDQRVGGRKKWWPW